MQTMTLCTSGVFSTVRNSASVPMSMPQFGKRRARVLEQALLEGGIDPGARHHLGAQRRRAAVHQVDAGGDLLRGQHALLDQQRAHGLLQHLVGAHRSGIVIFLGRRMRMGVVMVVVIVVMIVVVVVHVRSYLGRLEPMLVDVDFEMVAGRTGVVGQTSRCLKRTL